MKELIRNKWIEVSVGKTNLRLKYSTSSYFDNRHMISIGLMFISLYLHLPIYSKRKKSCEYPSYGFYTHGQALWICHGMDVKCLHMPWEMTWYRTSYLRMDGKYETELAGQKRVVNSWDDKWKGVLWEETHDYEYKLNSGEIQKRKATIRVVEREWRWRWFMWFKYIKHIRRTIEIDFNDEVGERTGSWKGGTMGCGYTLKDNETPLQCLRRMEKERKFN